MSKTLREIFIIISASAVIALICNSISPAGIPLLGQWEVSKGVVRADPNDKVAVLGREIEKVEIAKQAFDKRTALFVDARSQEHYGEGHIKGAVSLPLGDFDIKIDAFLTQYLPEQPIIVYCSGRSCEDSHHLAEMLMGFGYNHVSVMIDGLPGWVEKGYPIE